MKLYTPRYLVGATRRWLGWVRGARFLRVRWFAFQIGRMPLSRVPSLARSR